MAEKTICNQEGCDAPGAFRFTWPGWDEAAICAEHAPKLRAISQAMSFHLQLIPLEEVEDGDD